MTARENHGVDPLETQEFYELMQSYRHASIANQARVIECFDAVRAFLRLRTAGAQEWQGIESAPSGVRVLVCGGTYSTGDHEDFPSTGVSIAHLMGTYGWLDDSQYDGQEVWRKPTYWKPIPPPKGDAT